MLSLAIVKGMHKFCVVTPVHVIRDRLMSSLLLANNLGLSWAHEDCVAVFVLSIHINSSVLAHWSPCLIIWPEVEFSDWPCSIFILRPRRVLIGEIWCSQSCLSSHTLVMTSAPPPIKVLHLDLTLFPLGRRNYFSLRSVGVGEVGGSCIPVKSLSFGLNLI